MTTLTLLVKIYNTRQLKQIDTILGDLFKDLNVEATVTGTLAGKWVQLDLSGEDEEIATNILAREVGLCPINFETVKKFATLRGYVVNPEKSKDALLVDIGISQPKLIFATISFSHMQKQIADGKQLSLKRICELWGINENRPVNIKVINVNSEEAKIEAELQSTQIRQLLSWRDSLLDRLIVLGASLYEVNTAINQERLNRDIINIESMGLFEHALICKLGTDAAGLISRMGKRLRKAKFTVFNPKKIFSLST